MQVLYMHLPAVKKISLILKFRSKLRSFHVKKMTFLQLFCHLGQQEPSGSGFSPSPASDHTQPAWTAAPDVKMLPRQSSCVLAKAEWEQRSSKGKLRTTQKYQGFLLLVKSFLRFLSLWGNLFYQMSQEVYARFCTQGLYFK